MEQIIHYQPSDNAPFVFDAILDNVAHQVEITGNAAGTWITLTRYGGGVVFTKPLVRSSDSRDINLCAGYGIKSVFIFRASNNTFEIDSVRSRVKSTMAARTIRSDTLIYDDLLSDFIMFDDLSSTTIANNY